MTISQCLKPNSSYIPVIRAQTINWKIIHIIPNTTHKYRDRQILFYPKCHEYKVFFLRHTSTIKVQPAKRIVVCSRKGDNSKEFWKMYDPSSTTACSAISFSAISMYKLKYRLFMLPYARLIAYCVYFWRFNGLIVLCFFTAVFLFGQRVKTELLDWYPISYILSYIRLKEQYEQLRHWWQYIHSARHT